MSENGAPGPQEAEAYCEKTGLLTVSMSSHPSTVCPPPTVKTGWLLTSQARPAGSLSHLHWQTHCSQATGETTRTF